MKENMQINKEAPCTGIALLDFGIVDIKIKLYLVQEFH